MKEPGPTPLAAGPGAKAQLGRSPFFRASRNEPHAPDPKTRVGPQPASLVSRTAIRPARMLATSTQLPLYADQELLRHTSCIDGVAGSACSLPPSRPPATARSLYSRSPALTRVAPDISRQWMTRLRLIVAAERADEAATSAVTGPRELRRKRQTAHSRWRDADCHGAT